MKAPLSLVAVLATALVLATPASAFTPPNAYYAKQWYLAQDHAFDAWQSPPSLAPVKIAIVDSGVDCSLPDLQGRILATQSFVAGSACTDTQGHGTVVAGEIAGNLGATGIVGLDYSAQLLIAKVVAPNGTIPLRAETAAIRWAADEGARVINLSFGAVRDPVHRRLDSYSQQEADSVAYAYRHGAVVVAAAGNSDEAASATWNWADWPAALPHVIGVGALNRSGNVPQFSDRDPVFVDLAAPGVDIFSTFPAALTALQHSCTPQGYTDCATGEYEHPQGTSFAAPQVSAAAGVLFGVDPALTNSQVATILERSADDVNAMTGCSACAAGRDRFSGWGRLDVARAVQAVLSGPLPAADRLEPNDTRAQAPALLGAKPVVAATLDYWDDPVDVYRVTLRAHERLLVVAHAHWHGAKIRLTVLTPHGKRLEETRAAGASQRLRFRAGGRGSYYVELRASGRSGGAYTLKLARG